MKTDILFLKGSLIYEAIPNPYIHWELPLHTEWEFPLPISTLRVSLDYLSLYQEKLSILNYPLYIKREFQRYVAIANTSVHVHVAVLHIVYVHVGRYKTKVKERVRRVLFTTSSLCASSD